MTQVRQGLPSKKGALGSISSTSKKKKKKSPGPWQLWGLTITQSTMG
jgi:hypothetical protein